jgi:hypothetical protein
MSDLHQTELNQLEGLHEMFSQIAKKRTSFEVAEWENVRELMPRKRATRGIQYEALEYLFEPLYEKVSEDELREHFLRIKGHLQQKGDPVKSAINLAIKELQRLSTPKFDIIKIQEASLVGKTRRYVQLIFTGFDSVINYEQFCSYIDDMLDNEETPIIRSIFNAPPDLGPVIFPGIRKEWLKSIQAYALINSSEQIDNQNPRTLYYFIPESQTNHAFLLLYERQDSKLPFIAFVSDSTSVQSIEDSQYIVYRGAEKLSKLKFYHHIWVAQKNMALEMEEVSTFWAEANEIASQIGNQFPQMTPKTVFKGLIAAHIRDNRKNRIIGKEV